MKNLSDLTYVDRTHLVEPSPISNETSSIIDWWIECSSCYNDPKGWRYWLNHDAMDELSASCAAAWEEMCNNL